MAANIRAIGNATLEAQSSLCSSDNVSRGRRNAWPMKTYQGSCHCGACRFEVELNLDHVRRCNCSICLRRGALIHRVPKSALRMLTPLQDLSIYEWGSGTAKDYFCAKCGILPFRIPRDLTQAELNAGKQPFHGWAINVRCLEGVCLSEIPIAEINGAELI